MSDFDIFWQAYPRKQNKADARKAFDQTESIRPDIQELLNTIKIMRRTKSWREGYIKLPGGWLRSEGWEDRPIETGPTPEEREEIVRKNREIEELANQRWELRRAEAEEFEANRKEFLQKAKGRD